MRILVADQNALLLAAIAATFGRHCEIVPATRRDVCMAHVEQRHFDVVVACEKLAGYTGLELLSEVEAASPTTLRIYAARVETLQRLGKRLDFFGLLGTLHYPIEARKLLVALKVARGKLPARPKPPKVKHVVLENEWDTGERLALLGQELEDAPAVPETPPIPEIAASEEPATEFWAAPDPAAETSAVQRARHIAEASSFEVSFEVSFEENPSRFDVTGHGAAPADADFASADFAADANANADAASQFDVSFDENPSAVATASHESFEEAPSPTSATADDGSPYVDDWAANDEVFADEALTPHRHVNTDRSKTPTTADAGASHATSAAAQMPTAYATALAQAQRATASVQTSAQTQRAAENASASAPAQRTTAHAAATSANQAGSPHAGDQPRAPSQTTSTPTGSKPTASKSAATGPSGANASKGPRPRQPTVPTAAQREAFQRALARRNAARMGGTVEAPPIDFSAMGTMSATPSRPAQNSGHQTSVGSSLSDLARMATTKRPLPGMSRSGFSKRGPSQSGANQRGGQPKRSEGNPTKRHGRDVGQPKRRVFVVGSGIAAALLAGIVTFELLRATPAGENSHHGRAARMQLFSPPSTLVADNQAGSPEQFTPAPPQPAATTPDPGTASSLPQPQTFDPDTAPPDPPPPPALERPGPMEPPSFGHGRPPTGTQGSADSE